MLRIGLSAFVVFGLSLSAAVGAEPETLPQPRQAPSVVRLPQAPLYYRVSDYERWQNYGITRSGRFRPLVITMPDGNQYYRYNGAPYPYGIVRPEAAMSYVTD